MYKWGFTGLVLTLALAGVALVSPLIYVIQHDSARVEVLEARSVEASGTLEKIAKYLDRRPPDSEREVWMQALADHLAPSQIFVQRGDGELLRIHANTFATSADRLAKDGKLIAGARLHQASPEGELLDEADGRLVRWRALAGQDQTIAVLIDLGPVEERAHRQALHYTFEATMLLFLALVFLGPLLTVQARSMQRFVKESGRAGCASSRLKRLPWWLPRSSRLVLRRWHREQRKSFRLDRTRLDSLDFLRGIVNHAPAAVLVLSTDMRLSLANPQAVAMLGLDDLACTNAQASRNLPAALDRFLEEQVAARLGSPSLGSLETQQMLVIEVAGVSIPLYAYAAQVRVRMQEWLVVYLEDRSIDVAKSDALERSLREAESARQSERRFLTTISHEIRTPLGGLTGMLDLLRRSSLNDEQRGWLDTADASAQQLRKLIDQTLDMSKIEAGHLVLKQVPFDIVEQFSPIIRAASAQAAQKDLRLDCTWDIEQRMVLGDPVRISQILNNLLDNAVKFTHFGGVRITLKTVPQPDDLVRLNVVVSDSGIGISAENLRRLFHPFSQGSENIGRRFGGTGLGLALCRELCERMGGQITAHRNERSGMSFRFWVQLKPAHGMSPYADDSVEDEFDPGVLSGRRVLVADDNKVNQALLRRWLTDEGMTVTLVSDGDAAITAVMSGAIDVVLMDISMPVMNGLDATRAIRALGDNDEPKARGAATLPIIGISAHALLGDKEQCLALGMNDYVTKPIHRDQLLSKISRVLASYTEVSMPPGNPRLGLVRPPVSSSSATSR